MPKCYGNDLKTLFVSPTGVSLLSLRTDTGQTRHSQAPAGLLGQRTTLLTLE